MRGRFKAHSDSIRFSKNCLDDWGVQSLGRSYVCVIPCLPCPKLQFAAGRLWFVVRTTEYLLGNGSPARLCSNTNGIGLRGSCATPLRCGDFKGEAPF